MGAVNRGKQFEEQVHKALDLVPNTTVTRLKDPQNGFAGVRNECDFIAYHYPHQYFLECKSCHGNTLSIKSNNPKQCYGDITNTQWEGLLEASSVVGVVSGVLVWFIEHNTTLFVPIKALECIRNEGAKSLNITKLRELGILYDCYTVPGIKKRVLFDYDFTDFLGGD